MILVSLTAQARAAVACEAMSDGTSPRYCCPVDQAAPCQKQSGDKAVCCDHLAPATAPLAQAAASIDAPQHTAIYPVDPLIAATDFLFLPVALDSRDRYRLSPELTSRYRLRPLYLQTARLRL